MHNVFSHRIVNTWNSLPADVILSPTLNCFKEGLIVCGEVYDTLCSDCLPMIPLYPEVTWSVQRPTMAYFTLLLLTSAFFLFCLFVFFWLLLCYIIVMWYGRPALMSVCSSGSPPLAFIWFSLHVIYLANKSSSSSSPDCSMMMIIIITARCTQNKAQYCHCSRSSVCANVTLMYHAHLGLRGK